MNSRETTPQYAELLVDGFIKMQDKFIAPVSEDELAIENALRAVFGDDKPENIAGLTHLFRLSRLLSKGNWIKMTELSEKLMIEKYTATRLVSRWVEKGLAKRSGDPKDRRCVRIALTQEGKHFQEVFDAGVHLRLENMMQRLTPEEQSIFMILWLKLAGP